MATDSYMVFTPYKGKFQYSESQVTFPSDQQSSPLGQGIADQPTMQVSSGKISSFGAVFEVEDYSFDIEQALNIGSQSGGTGAGRVTFNPFSITRKIDNASPYFFQMCCAGTAFKAVALGLRKSTGGSASGEFFLRFDFKLVAVKTISWSHDEESPKETLTFEYGGMLIRYYPQNPDGSLYNVVAQGGWNRIKNKEDITTEAI